MPTSEFVSLFTTPLLDRLCFFNKKWTHKYLFSLLWGANNKALGQNEWRQNTLGLPPIGKYGMLDELRMNPDIPVLMACSTLTCVIFKDKLTRHSCGGTRRRPTETGMSMHLRNIRLLDTGALDILNFIINMVFLPQTSASRA